MVDFKRLMEEKGSKPAPEEVTVPIEAQRTNCFTGKTKTVTVHACVREGTQGKKAFVLTDGVTGFESFYLDGAAVGDMLAGGWCACMGTAGRWDTLYVPADQMAKAFDVLGIKE